MLTAGALVARVLVVSSLAQTTATVTHDRVNVRGRPTVSSEVITQLHKGEPVVVLEEIKAEKPKAGEPAVWSKIQMPANTPVWVNAGFVDPSTKLVTVKKLNLRAGPGENYSVVGLLTKDSEVKEVRIVDQWMEIEAPTNTWAFLAADYLEKGPAAVKETPTEPAKEAAVEPAKEVPAPIQPDASQPVATPPSTPPQADNSATPPTQPAAPVTEATKDAAAAAPALDATAAPVPAPQPAPSPVAPPEKPAEPAPDAVVKQPETGLVGGNEPPVAAAPSSATNDTSAPLPGPITKRIVRREGVVKTTVSIQAPTYYELVATDTGKTINYLHPLTPDQKVKTFKGRHVIVTGEELIDPRWPKTPVINLDTIEPAP